MNGIPSMATSRTVSSRGITSAQAVLAALLWLSLIGCDGQSARDADTLTLKRLAAEQVARKDAAERELLIQECRTGIEVRKAEYRTLIASQKYWEAALTVRVCAEALADPGLRALVSDAEIKSHLRSIDDPKTPARDKIRAIEMLARDYPEKGKQYESRIPNLLAQADRKERADQSAIKKREGVHLGMNQEDVLASSWGKPQYVNRTTFASGTREQWVYDGRNYLYFENGKLTAFQN